MHVDGYNIYIDQLRNGKAASIDESLPTDFMDVQEDGLSFTRSVIVKGKAYIAEQDLIINLDISAHGIVPCSICNELVDVEIAIDNFYHAEPLAQIKSGIFDFRPIIREAVLLDTPAFAECQGHCPKRGEVAKYLKKPHKNGEEGYHPFADLDL
jgi:uncharacterized metal-binding protein YceD (DUF177 family)